MKWFELSVSFVDDPKIHALRLRLGNPLAEAFVVRLYSYCYEHEQDTFTGAAALHVIEHACGYRGKRGALVVALLETGFIERRRSAPEAEGRQTGGRPEAEALIVHGVAKRLVDALTRRERAATRQRRIRGNQEDSPDVTGNTFRERACDIPDSHGKVSALSQGDQTRPDQTVLFSPVASQPVEGKPAKKLRAKKPAAETDPLHQPLIEALVAAYESERGVKYAFQGRDLRAVKLLLAASERNIPEVVRRFRVGLGESFKARVDGIHELSAKWNALSGASPAVARASQGALPVAEHEAGELDLRAMYGKGRADVP